MSHSAGFNLSTAKKEDVSTRLKVHNIKRAKNETRKLETEGKKMEERLQELKMAMNREKEERERQGGGFWKSGQHGSLTTYADDVLAKKKTKNTSVKANKIKILKDKPLDLPERSNQPGTIAYIAQRGTLSARDKPRGPRCGQCEERTAAVSCMQCSEDYCAGCFAAFHLKGNLKKHRSVPIGANPRQCFASPRPSASSTNNSYDFDETDVDNYSTNITNSARKKGRNSPDGASVPMENSLLQGSYDEAGQAEAFQEALNAWRTGKAANKSANGVRASVDNPNNGVRASHSEGNSRQASVRSARRGGVPYSPVQTPTVNVDSSTGTSSDQQDIEIKFNTASMSYAERLLLKKHRRTDVDQLHTPRSSEGSSEGSVTSGVTPRSSARGSNRVRSARGSGSRREKSNVSVNMEYNDGDLEGQHIDFHSLYEAVKQPGSGGQRRVEPDNVSIVEVQDNMDVGPDGDVAYKIQEVGEIESWNVDQNNKMAASQPQLEARPPTTGKPLRTKSGRKSVRSSREGGSKAGDSIRSSRDTENTSGMKVDGVRLKSARADEVDNMVTERDSQILGSRLKDIENEVKRRSHEENLNGNNSRNVSGTLPSSASQERLNSSLTGSSKPGTPRKKWDLSKQEEPLVNFRPPSSGGQSKSAPKSATARSAKSRAQASSRAQSRQGQQSRAGSRQGSRANSRIGSSRASSRADNPGLLTKAPSDALKEIARMTPTQSSTYKGGDSIFMLGVQPSDEPEERTITPTKHKDHSEKIKVSYQLYNMAPRSWKPDMSLMDAVDAEDVDQSDAEEERASSVMAYHAYSEQLVSDMTERLMSRFDTLPLDDDVTSEGSSGGGGAHRSLGEEYRTWTPRSHSHGSSIQDSPSMSARATPVMMMRSQMRDPTSQTPRRTGPALPSSAQTPRQSASLSRSQTPRASRSRAEQLTRRSQTYHGEPERPMSRAIVMEGTDLSIFDNMGDADVRDADDEETLDQLEFELASQSGRITAEGTISRMEMPEDLSAEEDSLNSSMESFRARSRLGADQGYDINSRLKREELEDEEDVSTDDESDVRNLM